MRISSPKRLLALDTEVANRWWWYDGKSTNRLMMFVGQFLDGTVPFGWIALPDVLLNSDAVPRYSGLPITDRETMLMNVRDVIASADTLIGHNLTGFDIGGINGELKLLNMPLLEARPVIDTLKSARPIMGQSMSLANRLSRLDGAVQKPHVDPVIWERAFNEFDPDALREVWARATADVAGHIELFLNDYQKGYLS